MPSVVISGIGGRFPQCDDIEEFYRKLLTKEPIVSEYFNSRDGTGTGAHDVPFAASKLKSIAKFDQTFFSLHSRVANVLDPLMRSFIEPCFEAVIDAGINPRSLAGSNTSVYTNSCISDDEALGCDERLTTSFWLLAHVRCLLANRISYLFDLKGPSFTIDNSWTGGIECLKQAVADLSEGRVDYAIVGVSNLLLNANLNSLFQGLDRLSDDGKTRSFDVKASGYVRSEGVVALFLQRSDTALRSYGEVLHVDATFQGSLERSYSGLNLNNLIDFFTEFYKKAKVDPASVDFIEADGSAVKGLDLVELAVLSQLFCKDRSSDLKVGSVKSNIGHSEGAASLMSLVKVLLAMNTGSIAPNLDFEKPHPNMDRRLKIVTEPTPLSGDLVAVSSFSLTGSVAHVLLKRHPAADEDQKKNALARHYPRLVLLSSRTEKGVMQIVEKLEKMPFNNDFCSLVNQTFKEPVNGFFYNGYTLLPPPTKAVHGSLFTQPIKRPVWFVYTGMGSQWPGMARELMWFAPFRKAVLECDRVYRPLGLDIINIITSDDPTMFDDILNSFVAIVTCHIGLTELLRAVGIVPDGYLGHSLGENGVAYADGCFNIRETCLGGYARGYVSKKIKLKPGLMVSVGVNYKNLTDLPPSIDIACHNSDDNTTISGAKEDIEAYLKTLKARNVFHRVVNSSLIAYHSRQVRPLAPKVLEIFQQACKNPKKRSSKWISSSIPESEWDSPLAQTSSAEYHVNNFLSPVLFTEACTHIPENAIVIEVAPHGLLQALLKRTTSDSCVNVPLCRRQCESPANFLLAALGQLHINGLRPNIEVLYEADSFPVPRGTPCLSPLIIWNHEDEWDVFSPNIPKDRVIQIDLLNKEYRPLFSHQVNGFVVPPLSFFLIELYTKLLAQQKKHTSEEKMFVCEEFKMHNLVEMTSSDVIELSSEITPGTGMFEQLAGSSKLATGRVYFDTMSSAVPSAKLALNQCSYSMDAATVYRLFKEHQYELSAPFDLVKQVYIYEEGCHAQIVYNGDLTVYLDTILKVKVFLDLNDDGIPVFPSIIRQLILSPKRISNLTPGSTLDVFLDFHTGEVSAPGVYMSKVVTSSFHYQLQDEAKLNSIHFVPHFTSLSKNVATKKFLYCLIQLIIDNFSSKKRDAHLTMVTVNNCFPGDIVKHIQKKLTTVAEVDVVHSQNAKATCDLLLCSYEALSEARQLNATFVLVSVSPGDVVDQNHNIVAHYHFKEEGLLLIKNKTKPQKYSVIRPEITSQWTKCLKTKDTPLLVWEDSYVDVQNTVKRISAMVQPFVCIFIMDPKAPRFSLDEPFYQLQLSRQLKVNVFKNGEWGSFYFENLAPVPEMKYPIIMPEFFGSAKYLGLNLKDNTYNISSDERNQELGHIEFSGMIEGGVRIMGLAKFDSQSCTIHPDPELTWHVPQEWNLQDAVTVPYAYTTVYYALAPKLNSILLLGKYSILIESGHTLIGQAAITFALSRNLQVYTTVPDVRKYTPLLKQHFPQLKSSQIFSDASSHFDVELILARKGKGVNLVFGSLCGDHFDSARRCLSQFGTLVQIGSDDMKKNKPLGLNFFIRSTQLSSCSNMDVYSSSLETKREIKKMIERDMESGIIQPLKRCIFDTTETHEALKALKTESQETKVVLSLTRNPHCDSIFTCLSNRTYLVVVNSTVRSHKWLNIIEWLLKRSARRIIIAFESSAHNDYVDHRINKLFARYSDSLFTFLPLSCFNSEQGIRQAMHQCVHNKVHALDAVITLKLDEKRLYNLDQALRVLAPHLPVFLCLQSAAEALCEARRADNMPSLCVQCASTRDLTNHLDTLSLECNNMSTSPLVIVHTKRQQASYVRPNVFKDIFPLSLDELVHISHLSPSDSQSFRPVLTKSPGLGHSIEVFPVFFVSSLGPAYLEPLLSQLLYPALVSSLPAQIGSVAEYARSLTRSLKTIQKEGPYTLVGEIWSSCVVLEITKLLEKGGDKVTVILLEGVPDAVESSMQDIVNLQSPTLEIELLADLVQVENNVCYNKSLEENMSHILGSLSEPFKTACKTTLGSLTSLILLSSQYCRSPQALQEKVKSLIVYICFSHTPILFTYNAFEKYHSGELILKVSETSSYFQLLEHKTTAEIINDYANFNI